MILSAICSVLPPRQLLSKNNSFCLSKGCECHYSERRATGPRRPYAEAVRRTSSHEDRNRFEGVVAIGGLGASPVHPMGEESLGNTPYPHLPFKRCDYHAVSLELLSVGDIV